ncbi:hypothetical protein Tco_1148878 [Tanacetum coccineum]
MLCHCKGLIILDEVCPTTPNGSGVALIPLVTPHLLRPQYCPLCPQAHDCALWPSCHNQCGICLGCHNILDGLEVEALVEAMEVVEFEDELRDDEFEKKNVRQFIG